MPGRSNLRKKGFILAHRFRGLSPEGWSNSAYGAGWSMRAGAALPITVGKAGTQEQLHLSQRGRQERRSSSAYHIGEDMRAGAVWSLLVGV